MVVRRPEAGAGLTGSSWSCMVALGDFTKKQSDLLVLTSPGLGQMAHVLSLFKEPPNQSPGFKASLCGYFEISGGPRDRGSEA